MKDSYLGAFQILNKVFAMFLESFFFQVGIIN